MGTTVNNRNGGDGSGIAVLGIVAVTAIAGIIAAVIAALVFVLAIAGIGATAVLAFRWYQLRVWQTVALAAIAARMEPPPFREPRQIPTVHELTWGRERHAAYGDDAS